MGERSKNPPSRYWDGRVILGGEEMSRGAAFQELRRIALRDGKSEEQATDVAMLWLSGYETGEERRRSKGGRVDFGLEKRAGKRSFKWAGETFVSVSGELFARFVRYAQNDRWNIPASQSSSGAPEEIYYRMVGNNAAVMAIDIVSGRRKGFYLAEREIRASRPVVRRAR